MKIIFVAPYCPSDREGPVSPGAAAKIEAVVSGMTENSYRTILVNSGHQGLSRKSCHVSRLRLDKRGSLELQPLTLSCRPLGKALQCLQAFPIALRLLSWRPEVVWIYNTYLFEAIIFTVLKMLRPNTLFIVEIEDLPFSRPRSKLGRIKNSLDAMGFTLVLNLCDGITVVQSGIKEIIGLNAVPVYYLPVLMRSSGNASMCKIRTARTAVVGYFGGLNEEKGVGKLISVVKRSSGQFIWTVGGSGPLGSQLKELSEQPELRLRFVGSLDSSAFQKEYSLVDIILNLHAPLSEFGFGIFPFKLLEGIANGKIVISNRMIGCPKEVESAIYWIDHQSDESVIDALQSIQVWASRTEDTRARAKRWILDNFTASSFVKSLVCGTRRFAAHRYI